MLRDFSGQDVFEETSISGPTLSGIGGEYLVSKVCQDGSGQTIQAFHAETKHQRNGAGEIRGA